MGAHYHQINQDQAGDLIYLRGVDHITGLCVCVREDRCSGCV